MKKTLLSALFVALLVGLAAPAGAKDTLPPAGGAEPSLKPVAIVSIAGYDKILSDLGVIGQLIQQPGLDKRAEGAIMFFTGGLQGVDRKRPWGIVINTDGASFPPLAFLPVTDLKALTGSLAGLIGPPADAGNGILEFDANNQKLYVKEQTGWAFIGQKPEHLTELPADPIKLLKGLEKQYEIAVQFNVQNVPEVYRSMAVDQLKSTVATGLQPQEGEDEVAFQVRQKVVQNQMKAIEELINEADQFTIGWSLDQANKTTGLDISMTGMPNSDLAKKLSNVKEAPSGYSGFVVPKSAATVNFVQSIPAEDAEQMSLTLDSLKTTVEQEIDKSEDLQDADAKSACKDTLAALIDALKATVKSGKSDGAASLLLGEKTLTAVGGVYLAKPADFEKSLRKLLELASKDPNAPKISFDATKYGDVRFHTVKLPVPQDQKIAAVLGSTLDVAIGFGPKSVYVGLGTDSMSALKKAIDQSKADAAKKMSPGTVDIALQPILAFASAVDDNPLLPILAGELAKSGGKDHITLNSKPIKNGVTYRLDLQQGVLNLIGATMRLQQGGQGGPNPGGVPIR